MVGEGEKNVKGKMSGYCRFLWRGSLLPPDCGAAHSLVNAIRPVDLDLWFYDCYAAERERAPSPQRVWCKGVRLQPAGIPERVVANFVHKPSPEWIGNNVAGER